MLEIRYNTDTKRVSGWCGDEKEIGLLGNRAGEEITIIDMGVPSGPLAAYLYDPIGKSLIDNPDFVGPEPPRSTYISAIEAIDIAKARPVKVKRVWQGKDYFYDCLVTESVKDQYAADDIHIGDYVIVHFDDIGEQIVTAKIFKSW